ncbi:peptidylprolyl isomerase ESS1 PWA37_003089 [Arxiozyma heterogenica]|uniref:Peptidyl-prolyl cis-trans isomerase n=1 Tax=Arxiozyma heterogenica TaxID=278026 RepID=A0AAN7WGN2_9SACH|nr:hypothetical protein RI543_004719 [Kazachstania heterogenica]
MTDTGLPEHWTIRYSKSKKREYFFNSETKKSQWEAPANTDINQLKKFLTTNPTKVHCLHILIKHKDSRRPASHRSTKITISKEDAIKELQEIQGRLNYGNEEETSKKTEDSSEKEDVSSGRSAGTKDNVDKTVHHKDKDSFENIARERSDCSSYKRGGDLGWFGRGEMQPSFEKVAFSLPIGKISDIVETDSGVHLIKRIG